MLRVLVTGGSGFIGSHLVAASLARGHYVRIFDQAAPKELGEGAEFVEGSITVRTRLLQALDGIDRIYHLAGIAHLWNRHGDEFDRINRMGTEVLLSAAAEKKIQRIVHCSTEAVLLPPKRSTAQISESAELKLGDMAGPYSRSKFAAEQAALQASRQGQPIVVVNPTVPLGADDYRLTPPTAMIARCLGGRLPVSLDFTFNVVDVRDIAEGMILAAEKGRIGERYILGGENISMRELAKLLETFTGKNPIKIWIPPRFAMVGGLLGEWWATHVTRRMPAATIEGIKLAIRSGPFDISKACREIGFAPRPIGPAVERTIDWLKRADLIR
jgi:dihydroflavonol-4-reductase